MHYLQCNGVYQWGTGCSAIHSTCVPVAYKVSKQLVAYLQKLVAFSQYYRADDPHSSGKMETLYHKSLERYKGFEYKAFHAYIIGKMTTYYRGDRRRVDLCAMQALNKCSANTV